MRTVTLTKPTTRKAPVKRKPTTKVTPIPVTETTRLGIEIRDPMSALKGFASARMEMINGNVQYAIQPRPAKGDSDKVMDAHFIDYHLLEQIGIGYSDRLPDEDDTVTAKLGDYLIDTVSGFKGIAVEKWTFANGCVYFNLQSKPGFLNQAIGDLPGAARFPHGRLRLYIPWYDAAAAWFTKLFSPKAKPVVPLSNGRSISVAAEKPAPARRPPGGPGRVLTSRTM